MNISNRDDHFYQRIVNSLSDGVYVLNRERGILFWNRAAEEITGFSADQVVGRCCRNNILNHVTADGVELCASSCPVVETIQDGKPREARVYLHHKDGHRVPVQARVTPFRGRDGGILGAVEVFSNCTQQLEILAQIEKLHQLAFLDHLTGIGNRRFTEQTLTSRFEETQRYGWSSGLLFTDIDHFKKINDTFGHETGDDVLKMVATTMKNALRPFDFVGRWGGEEFIVLLPQVDEKELKSIAERIRLLVAQSFLLQEENPIRVTVSIGGTLIQKSDTPNSTTTRADHLMYQAKLSGRNRAIIS